MEFIYIIKNPFDPNHKIGSTKYPNDRINSYKTYCSEPWEVCLLLKILNKSCYIVDELIKENEPYPRSKIENAGTEWYSNVDDGDILKEFLKENTIEFEVVTDIIDQTRKIDHENIKKENIEKEERNEIILIEEERNEIILKDKKHKFEFRYGQKEVFDNFNNILEKGDKYWGAIIAPTGWGKSLVHLLLIGLYVKKHKKNIILLTKRKDVLIDLFNSKDSKKKIQYLQDNNLFPIDNDIEILEQVEGYDFNEINKETDKPKLIIINVDKLIDRSNSSYDTDEDDIGIKIDKKKYELVKWEKIGLLIFDELHWAGAKCISELIGYCKDKVDYGIGSSATPVRENDENQNKIYSLFGENKQLNKELNILHEVSYEEAWENKIIVPIEHHYFPISSFKHTKGDGKKFKYEFKDDGKIEIIENIKKIKLHYNKMIFYFHSRKSLLIWHKFIKDNNLFDHKLFMSFHLDDNIKTEFELDGKEKEIEEGIQNFKEEEENAILFVVNKATEGFDDKRVELIANLDYTKSQGIVQLIQKLGRCQRIMDNKTKGYYISPIPMDKENEDINYLCSILDNYLESIRSKNKMLFGKGKCKENFEFISKYIKFKNFKKKTIEEIHNKIKENREKRYSIIKMRNDVRKFNNELIKNNDFRLLINNNELIFNYDKILNYIDVGKEYEDKLKKEKDLVKFCLGDNYDKLKDIYYHEYNDIKKECIKLNINSIHTYDKYISSNLPPRFFLNSNLWNINLTKLLDDINSSNHYDY